MTYDELVIHVDVLEKRLAKLSGALVVLLQAIEEGTGDKAAGAIRVSPTTTRIWDKRCTSR